MSGPFDGIRVIDLTSMISGPSTTMILADQGADVIKVENPKGGDHTRGVSTSRNGFSASFVNNNRNKRSVTLNLKSPRGVEALLRLARDGDVFVQNFRPGVADRIGVGEDAIRAVAPSIIYVSISGFGESGPYAQKPVYDPLVQALSGLTTVQAGSDEQRPRLVRTILPDKLTGYAASQAISAALFHRERTGEGQHIRLSMLDTLVSFLWGSDMGGHTFVGDELQRETAQSFIDLVYETSDGYISVAVQSNKEWAGICGAFEKPEWQSDARFATAALRGENIDERLQLTQEVLKTRTTADWLARLEADDVPCAPVLTRREVIRHPQIIANETIIERDHPVAGKLRQTQPAPRFSKTPTSYRSHAPGLGEQSVEILTEAGLSEEEIQALIKDGIVASMK
ncbi:MAG: carnitine dehydratase [Hyphomicrobiales bacterium]|nr:MAG: carnitine dehydratase [Hyphomicrobiales bacterium]